MSYLEEYVSSFRKNGRVKIGFLGIGKSNMALFSRLESVGNADFVFRDQRESLVLPEETIKNVSLKLGKDALSDINEDVLFLSPSVRRDTPELVSAKSRGIALCSDCEVFFKYNSTPVIGITGSDGKSTTTSLTSRILQDAGYSAPALGNIGAPMVTAHPSDYIVCELSSFNLEYLSPRLVASAITNITENHLNWHTSFEEYVEAKKNILRHSDKTVLSADDPISQEIIKGCGAKSIFSTSLSYSELKRSFKADTYYTHSFGKIEKNGEFIADTRDFLCQEDYNVKNMLTALALTDEIIDPASSLNSLRSFAGLEHRCERFLFKNGILFINSSIDTTPQRTAKTLTALGKRVRIILGGRGKGLSYSPLRSPLNKYAERISVYGEARYEIEDFFKREGIEAEYECFDTFYECVAHALSGIESGDVLILSPACTAYGEFSDFSERGRCFKDLIKNFRKI